MSSFFNSIRNKVCHYLTLQSFIVWMSLTSDYIDQRREIWVVSISQHRGGASRVGHHLHLSSKALTSIVLSLFMAWVGTGNRLGLMRTKPYGSEISCHYSYLKQGSCPTATTQELLSAKASRISMMRRRFSLAR